MSTEWPAQIYHWRVRQYQAWSPRWDSNARAVVVSLFSSTLLPSLSSTSNPRTSDFDYTNNRYIVHKQGASPYADTVFMYSMLTKVLTTYTIFVRGVEMAYSPASNKVLLMAQPMSTGTGSTYGIHSLNLATDAVTMETAINRLQR